MAYILAVDQGTTSCRAVLFNKLGEVVNIAQKEFTQHFPKNGWVEHNALEILNTQISVIQDIVKKSSINAKDIIAMGITNQRETTVVWDKTTGQPIYNAIVWQDKRTASYCEALKEKHKEKILKTTGLVIDSYFSASKINWLLSQHKGKTDRLLFGTIDTWLLWNLSKEQNHFTDVTNASRTMLFNINTLSWDKDLLSLFNVPKHILPEVKENCCLFGTLKKEILGVEIPILAMCGDQQSALFGQQCFEEGMAKNTYGTGCFILANIGNKPKYSKKGLLTTIAYKINNKTVYAFEGSVFDAGSSIQWLRDGLNLFKNSSESNSMATAVPDTGNVCVVPALSGLGTPYWDMFARGLIIGISRFTTPNHIVRATLEAIAFQSKMVLNLMEKESKVKLKTLKVDGGASNNDFLMQTQANCLNINVCPAHTPEITAFGVALMAGYYADFYSLNQNFGQQNKEYKPKEDLNSNYTKWQKAVKKTLGWARE